MIPIDKADNSYAGIEKALDLYASAGVCFHLVKLITTRSLMDWIKLSGTERISLTERVNRAKNELAICLQKITETHPSQIVQTEVMICSGKTCILEQYVNRHQIDLVVTARSGNNHFFSRLFLEHGSYLRLSKQTGIPLLSVLQQKNTLAIKSVLISITGAFADTKIQIALEIAKRYNAQIHIVTILNNSETDIKERIDAFYHSFKILSEYGYSPKYKILQGGRICESMMQYARQIKADLILVNPDKEYLVPVSFREKWQVLLQQIGKKQELALNPVIQAERL